VKRRLEFPRRKIDWSNNKRRSRRGYAVPSTPIGAWMVISKKRGERALRESLALAHGCVVEAAKLVGCKKWTFWWHLRNMGLTGLPREIRERVRNRFRLPAA